MAEFLKPSVAGFLLQKELDYLDGAVSNPKRPFAAIVGGSKVLPPSPVRRTRLRSSRSSVRGLPGASGDAVAMAELAAAAAASQVSSKIGVIESLLAKVDKLVIGGGMVFTFLKARGLNVGRRLSCSCCTHSVLL